MGTIQISNDGPEIIATNYWETPLPGRGLVYVSVNARTFRILVPRGFELSDFGPVREVIVFRGPWPDQGMLDAIEVLFDDGTVSPFALHLSPGQIDRLPGLQDSGRRDLACSVWIRGGKGQPVKALEWRAGFRVVPRIPCLKPWEETPERSS